MANNTLLTVFVIVTALAVVTQACILAAMAIAARKTQTEVLGIVKELRGHLAPVLINAREILEDSAPRVRKITANLEHVSDVVREQTDHLHVALDDLLERSQKHVLHADAIVGETLNTVDRTRSTVSVLIAQPLKWATAVSNGLRAGIDSFLTRRGGGAFAAGFSAAHGAHDSYEPFEPDTEEIFD